MQISLVANRPKLQHELLCCANDLYALLLGFHEMGTQHGVPF